MYCSLQRIAALLIVGSGVSSAFVQSSGHQSNHQSQSSYSSGSSHQSGHSYSYTSKSARGPGYSYSYSYTDEGPLFLPIYASGYHTYTPLFLPLIDFDLDFDLDDIDDLDFFIDTDLDLDLDLDFLPGIEYGLGYVGKYGHLYRLPKYRSSRLYSNIDLDLDFWNYGGRYGYESIESPSTFGSLFNFFK